MAEVKTTHVRRAYECIQLLEGHRLRHSDFKVLAAVSPEMGGPTWRAEVGSILHMPDASLAVAINRMVNRGFLSRTEKRQVESVGEVGAPRTVYLSLTDKGERLMEEFKCILES